MKLTSQELSSLDRNGFLVISDRFSGQEVNAIRSRLPHLISQSHPGNIVERSSGVVRTTMGLHLRDPLFAKLVGHPRLIQPAQQIYSEPFYAQQVKVNVKAAFTGEVWQWHYDFATHREQDGVPKPLALNLHIFLDDVTEFNGPLYFIPASHKAGEHAASFDTTTTSYPLWVVDQDTIRRLADKNGLVAATGRAGTVLIFHDMLVHGSPSNLSPWDRSIFSLVVNPVSNAYRNRARPDHMHHRSLEPLEQLNDDCLLVDVAA